MCFFVWKKTCIKKKIITRRTRCTQRYKDPKSNPAKNLLYMNKEEENQKTIQKLYPPPKKVLVVLYLFVCHFKFA